MKMWVPFFIKEGKKAIFFLLQSLSQPVMVFFYLIFIVILSGMEIF